MSNCDRYRQAKIGLNLLSAIGINSLPLMLGVRPKAYALAIEQNFIGFSKEFPTDPSVAKKKRPDTSANHGVNRIRPATSVREDTIFEDLNETLNFGGLLVLLLDLLIVIAILL
ncbi:hypothetical protein N836_02920 [Leptolyngbya sp. Heron Island J]|uniref:hypothetical protein n=1 Tax=Leptolyngbya sp. Heron Island J TaxID=1385935 RepID=UPI0003B9ACBE|nr:hypothetical protein [Leptolyngbya sp. Heron Island J]ESA37482.1 hypothetical protein N836_02920 [Leptolyngbya sp. Heron Island J]